MRVVEFPGKSSKRGWLSHCATGSKGEENPGHSNSSEEIKPDAPVVNAWKDIVRIDTNFILGFV